MNYSACCASQVKRNIGRDYPLRTTLNYDLLILLSKTLGYRRYDCGPGYPTMFSLEKGYRQLHLHAIGLSWSKMLFGNNERKNNKQSRQQWQQEQKTVEFFIELKQSCRNLKEKRYRRGKFYKSRYNIREQVKKVELS